MDRRRFLLTSLAGGLVRPQAVPAQLPKAVLRIGYLRPGEGGWNSIDEALEQSLQELGWIKGRNLRFEIGNASGRQDAMAGIARNVVQSGVDVLVVWGPPFAQAAGRVAPEIPLVFLGAFDPVAAGLVSNYARPGGKVTGVTSVAGPEVFAKRLQLLKEAAPSVRRVLVLAASEGTRTAGGTEQLAAAAKGMGVELDNVDIDTAAAAESVIRRAKDQGAHGLYVWPGGFVFSIVQQIADAARANRLASVYPFREGALAGCLLSYAVDLVHVARRGAVYVDKIFRGTPPGSLPIDQLSRYDFIINLKTAKALGLTIPPSLLLRADQVIE